MTTARRRAARTLQEDDAVGPDVPVSLRMGACIDVWSDGVNPSSACGRHRSTYRRLLASRGLDWHTQLPSSRPWAADRKSLSRFGVAMSDVPALREEAQAMLENLPPLPRSRWDTNLKLWARVVE